MGIMEVGVDVDSFLRSLKATKPPWECPKCGKVYKSYSGIEYHMLRYDHENATPTPNQKPSLTHSNKKGPKSRKKGRSGNIGTPRRSPSPLGFSSSTRDTLTWAEAQRMVEVESEGKIYRLDINEKLDIISDSDVDKDEESSSGSSSDSNSNQNKDFPKQPAEEDTKDYRTEADKNKGPAKITNINSKDLKNVSLAIQRDGADKNQNASAKLPIASFRLISDSEYEADDAPKRKTAYYRYIERPPDELAEEVEYDMDEEDSVWLELMNERREKASLPAITADQFELLMDRFEKESYFEQSRNGDPQQGVNQMIDEDAVCCVCNDGECQNSNVILFCDMCNLAVHQECYGVPYIPEGQWLCRRCLQSPSCPVDCVLCPNRGGAFKQTDDGRWAHVVCALWVPEVTFANTVFLEPIDGLKRIPQARWKLTCYICKQRNLGACIQCHRTNCYTAFHVTCAQQAGLYMKMEPVRETGKNGVTITVRKAAFCDVHRPADASPTKPLQNSYQFEEMDKRALSDSREKMKKARKILAEKRQEMPHIAIPYIPRDKMSEISKLVVIQKRGEFMQRLLSFWTLKRQSRNGVPLLRRLQSSMQSHRSNDSQSGHQEGGEVISQLKYWQRLRHDLERARLLIELIRKREKYKRDQLKICQAISEQTLYPWIKHLLSTLDRLRVIDTPNVFALPVNIKDAPEYDKIIKKPMDFSTMEKKIRNYEYKSLDEFEADVNLIVTNCMTYNTKDTIFYRLAVKLRDQGGTVIRNARRDADRIGFDPETGFLLDEAPVCKDESPGKILSEIDRLIDGHPRQDLTLEDQLKNLFEKLDFIMTLKNGNGKSYKTKKLRKEIMKVRRKLSASQRKEDSDVAPDEIKVVKSSPKVVKKKTINAQISSIQNHKENVNQPTILPRSLSTSVGPKKKKFHRKRLWSHVPSNTDRTDDGDNGTHKHANSPPPPPHKILKRSISTTIERPNTETENDSPNEFQKESVNRRSSVLFKKKKKINSNPVSRQNSDENNSKNNSDNQALSDSAIKNAVFPDTIKSNKLKWSQRDAVKTRSSDSNDSSDSAEKLETKKLPLTNGYLSGSGSESKQSASFSRYRDDLPNRRMSSDTDTTSTSSSNDIEKEGNEQKRLLKSMPSKSRRSSCSVVEAKRKKLNAIDHSPTSSTCDSDEQKARAAAISKRRRTTGSSSTEEDTDSCSLSPLDLVWAKCRGYPSYPALIIDPNMPRSGYHHNGVPIPVPPNDVLKAADDSSTSLRLYLVLFFDNKRTWQWLPASKLKPLGLDEKSDRLKLYEGKRPGIRRSVTEAYKRAKLHQHKVSGIIPESDDDVDNGNLAEEEDSSDSVN